MRILYPRLLPPVPYLSGSLVKMLTLKIVILVHFAKLFHADIIPQNASTGSRAGRINCQYGNVETRILEKLPKTIEESTFTHPGTACDTDAHSQIAMGLDGLHQPEFSFFV